MIAAEKKRVRRRGMLRGKNPFADLKKAHKTAAENEKVIPYQKRVRDWIHVKRSTSGSTLPKKKVILSLPVSGVSIQI